jgi:hypothetical protein
LKRRGGARVPCRKFTARRPVHSQASSHDDSKHKGMSDPGASICRGATVLRREGQHTGKKTWRRDHGVALPTHHRKPKWRKWKWSRWQIGSRWGDGGVVAGSTEMATRCRFSRWRRSPLLWLLECGRYSSTQQLRSWRLQLRSRTASGSPHRGGAGGALLLLPPFSLLPLIFSSLSCGRTGERGNPNCDMACEGGIGPGV